MSIRSRLRQALNGLALGYLGLAAWNGRVDRRTRNLAFPLPLDGEPYTYNWPGGRIFFTRRGQGEPILLAHAIYAGADSHEFRRIFGPLADRYQVYAYDLLGFGHSARPNVRYSGPLYVRLLSDFVREVIGRPTTVIANSLSAAYAIRAANDERSLIRRLILQAPSAGTSRGRRGIAGEAAYLALNLLPDLGEGLRNAIGVRAFLRYYYRSRVYYDPRNITDDLVDYTYVSVHQPGSQYPLIAFVTGHLDVPVDDALRALPQPVSLFWGREAKQTPLAEARHYLSGKPDATLHVIERSGDQAFDEQPAEFLHQTFDILAGRETAPAGEQAAAQAVPQAT